MSKQATEMTARIQRAVKSGKLKLDGNYTVPGLAAIIGSTRAELSEAVHREYGSVERFCTTLGFTGKI
jgi:hypothetical protein